MTWWNHLGTNEWINLNFEKPQTLSSLGVYWFDDGPRNGGCRVPESWTLSYKMGNDWIPIKTNDAFDVAPDQYNTVRFEPIETDEIRIDIKLREGFSGGILEVKLND